MSNTKNLYAVMIGINGYPKRPLTGCVNDVMAISDYFEKLCKAQTDGLKINWKPTYYLEPSDEEERSRIKNTGIKFSRPTRENIVAAFDHFKDADPTRGDYCLLYYSGHGSFMNTPEVFADYEPSGEVQTVVCVDSRDPGNRDLLDKELGYLIAKSLEGKVPDEGPKVHFLTIMDCCHSGSNTRGDETDVVARMETKGIGLASEGDITGFTREGNVFYEKFGPGQKRVKPGTGIRHGRYISLAGARDSELAKEKTMGYEEVEDAQGNKVNRKKKHGVFTYSLLKTLEQSGANITYAELMRRVEMEVRSLVDKQIPILGKTNFEDDNQMFLRNEFTTPKQQYIVRCREQFAGDEWYMDGGSLQGIVPSSMQKKTTVSVDDGKGGQRIVEVVEVKGMESVLDPSAFVEADKENNLLSATVHDMAFPRINVGFADTLSKDMQQQVITAWEKSKNNLKYIDLVTKEGVVLEYLIRSVQYGNEEESFILTRPESEIPLFIRHKQAPPFLVDVNKVGKWESSCKVANPDTGIRRSDIQVDVEVLEGQEFTGSNFEKIIEKEWPEKLTDPDIIHTKYVKDIQPAIKVRVTNKNDGKGYWVGALYLDSHFGITHEFLKVQEIGPETQDYVDLGFSAGGKMYNALALYMDPLYHEYGVTEIKDYIILFVSKKSFDLSNYQQDPIEMNPTRAGGRFASTVEKEDDWFTIKIPIHIMYPISKVKVSGEKPTFISRTFNKGGYNKPIKSAALSIQGSEGFSATVQATNRASAKRRVEQMKEGKSAGGMDEKGFLPPGSLWMESEGSEAVFSRNLATSPDNHLSILELTDVKGTVNENNPLRIKPGDPLLDDESILPFGYDPVKDVYFPLGYTNEKGEVVINQLPTETDGVIGADGEQEETDEQGRSLGGSMKMFFHKVVWSKLSGRHDYNTLTLVKAGSDGELERIEFTGRTKGRDVESRQAIQEAIANAQADILLLVHGIIGDTKSMVECACLKTDIHTHFGAVLSFDYENLNTPIEDTAKALGEMLTAVGLQDKRLVVVAHSMGGLVSRSFIEDHEGAAIVKKLIQVGTPNGGSEISDFRKKLTGWVTMGINGLGVVQPYLPILAFIWKGVENRIFHTLNQMGPGSDFLNELNNGSKSSPDVPYYLVAGDTRKVEADYHDEDPAWKKVWNSMTGRGAYLFADYAFFDDVPNDMAVKVDSMKMVPWGHEKIEEVICDHISYFDLEEGQVGLKTIMGL